MRERTYCLARSCWQDSTEQREGKPKQGPRGHPDAKKHYLKRPDCDPQQRREEGDRPVLRQRMIQIAKEASKVIPRRAYLVMQKAQHRIPRKTYPKLSTMADRGFPKP